MFSSGFVLIQLSQLAYRSLLRLIEEDKYELIKWTAIEKFYSLDLYVGVIAFTGTRSVK